MKILDKYIIGSVLTIVLLAQVSCKKDFLEITPKGKQIASATKDYEQMLNANFLAQSSASVFMGDEIAAYQPFFSNHSSLRTQRLFKYQDRIYDADQLPAELSGEETYINRLYLFNKIINEVTDSKNGTDEQKASILAEAKAGRAICNFMFLTDFSTPYNPATATVDLGIPELTRNDVTLTSFSRVSQSESYTSIIRDLTEAIPNLGLVTHRRKISKLAAQFYLARIYMAMQNYPAANVQLDNAFLEIPKSTIPLGLYNYNVVLNPTAAGTWYPLIFGIFLSGTPASANNTEVIYDITVSAVSYVGGDPNVYLMSPQTADLFDPSDMRPNMFDPIEYSGTTAFPRKMRHPIGFGTQVGASLSDLYLMRAECRARANNLTGAKEDMEALRRQRMGNFAVPAAIAGNQQTFVRFILDERIREFTFTGLRWLDMRRLSKDPVYADHVKYTHEVYSQATGLVSETYVLKPERFALKFGERMLRESNGLQENP
jgi:hypothetical protein